MAEQDTFKARVKRLSDAGNYHGLSLAYYEKAVMLHDGNKSYADALRESKKYELLHWQQSGAVKVRIMSLTGCAECRKLHGKAVIIEQALKAMPLPHKNCVYEMKPGSKRYFCRCKYVGAAEE